MAAGKTKYKEKRIHSDWYLRALTFDESNPVRRKTVSEERI
jgi:hypothetical protein